MAVVSLVQPGEEAVASLLPALVLEAEEADCGSDREIAVWIIAKYGRELVVMMSDAEYESAVTRLVNFSRGDRRRHHIRGERFTRDTVGGRESIMRISAVGKGYWEQKWLTTDGWKQTRELTPKDLEYLAKAYAAQSFESRARALLMLKWLEFARAHKAKTLGDLEAKGLELPAIEVVEE